MRARLAAVALVLPALLVACQAPPAAVESAEPRPPVEVRSAVDRAVATTGDLLTYRVTVDYDEAYEVEVPEPGAEIAGFRIIDLGKEEPRRQDGRVVEERWYTLRADLVGSYVLPPVRVDYRPAAGAADDGEPAAEAGFAEASALFVEVESVLPAAGEARDIRDLKPLRRVARPVPWGWVAAGLAAALLAAAAWLWWRRRARAEEPPLPAHEIAFQALDALRGTDFDDFEAMRRFYFAISEVVRAYLEGSFPLNATDLTSEEILTRLPAVGGLEPAHRGELRRFLLDTDAVKFADHRPGREEITATYERALGFVEATRPAEAGDEAAEVPEEKAA